MKGLWQRSSVFLGGKTWERGTRQTAGQREDLVEERERGFNLDVMRAASAVFGLLVELLPCPFRWQGFARQAFGSCRIRFWSRSSRTPKNISSPASQNTLTAYLRTSLKFFLIEIQFNPAIGGPRPAESRARA